MATFRERVLLWLPFGDGREGIADQITKFHDAQLATLQRRGDALAEAAEATLQVGTLQTLDGLGSALAAWRSAPPPGDAAERKE
jgi:hypothetical protein